jgi:predicted nuclease of restriction endonuclease-like (RecB) superfamily
MKKKTLGPITTPSAPAPALFDRVVAILEQARGNVVRAVNTNMVTAYWLIGREIVLELQGGEQRAEYGKKVIEDLSKRLNSHYGEGFSEVNLKAFRKFFLTYPSRMPPIRHPLGAEFEILDKQSDKSKFNPIASAAQESPSQAGTQIGRPSGDLLQSIDHQLLNSFESTGFSSQLSWSHYRALMRVENVEARDFYESEAIACGWDKRGLELHIRSFYYERMLKSQNPEKMIESARREVAVKSPAVEALKHPYVLEFLNLPNASALHETQLEAAIMSRLQHFRQKRMRFNETDYYVDLVFYNCILKCFVLIDLKMDELSHQDVGQMDGYVRMYDDLYTSEGDNPTIGLILCTDKNEAVAKYSVLNERKQIFASKYLLHLPSEEELTRELLRERQLIEAQLNEQAQGIL